MAQVPKILVLVGPTASGKTVISLILAQLLKGEIVSADSRQVYKYMDIGTAKPSRVDRARIPHHCIDIRVPSDEFSAGEYGEAARTAIREILGRGRLPIVVGGSGLYVKAAIDGLFDGPQKDAEIRMQLEDRLSRLGIEDLLGELRRVDPVSAEKIDPTKPRRIIRALEVYQISGKPLSEYHREQRPIVEWRAVFAGLAWRRLELYNRIDQRVDDMIDQGLYEEVKSLRAKGFDTTCNALNTVGYREFFDVLSGERDFTQAPALIKQNTRHYAKRQMTWFRAEGRIQWVEASDAKGAADLAQDVVKVFKSA
jgi:tRNA dimethylallyltransferase